MNSYPGGLKTRGGLKVGFYGMLNELLSWSTGHIVIGHDVPSRPCRGEGYSPQHWHWPTLINKCVGGFF